MTFSPLNDVLASHQAMGISCAQENRACLELAEQKERPRIVEKIKVRCTDMPKRSLLIAVSRQSIIEEGEKKADSDYQQLQQSQWQRIVALKTESGSPTKR